jgi:hypothetical protein
VDVGVGEEGWYLKLLSVVERFGGGHWGRQTERRPAAESECTCVHVFLEELENECVFSHDGVSAI